MQSLKDFLSSINLPPKVKNHLKLYLEIKKHWKEIMGEFSERTKPLIIEREVLLIGVSDHYLLQELNQRYLEIYERMENLLKEKGCPFIKGLKFIYWRGFEDFPEGKKKGKIISEEEVKPLEELCMRLPDKELSQTFQKILKHLSS